MYALYDLITNYHHSIQDSPRKRLLTWYAAIAAIFFTLAIFLAWADGSSWHGFLHYLPSTGFICLACAIFTAGVITFFFFLDFCRESWRTWRSAHTPKRNPLDGLNVESVGFLHRCGARADDYGSRKGIFSEIYVIDRDRGPVTLEVLKSPGLQNPSGAAKAHALAKRLGVPFHEA